MDASQTTEVTEAAERFDIGGLCPVEGIGEFRGHPVYFRARGQRWLIEVYDPGVDIYDDFSPDKPIWCYRSPAIYEKHEAGYITPEVARSHIAEGLTRWMEESHG